MTHDILQSDIDLARKLLGVGRPANEIVGALTSRGIDSERAAWLVAELQAGKAVEPDKPIKINLSPTQPPPAATPTKAERSRPTDLLAKGGERSRARQQTETSHWFTIIGLTAAAVCVVAFVFLSRRTHPTDSTEQAAGKSKAPIATSQREAGPGVDPKLISIEVETNGLRLCGNAVGRESFLAGIFKILGAATRTNQVEKGKQIIYAYDACGLLIYSPSDSGHYSIVVDFDGSDGDAGTKSAFVGRLKVNDYVVHAGTDAISLGRIKELALQEPTSASGIFRAQYAGLDLVFGYLKNPERLSLVEIDFK